VATGSRGSRHGRAIEAGVQGCGVAEDLRVLQYVGAVGLSAAAAGAGQTATLRADKTAAHDSGPDVSTDRPARAHSLWEAEDTRENCTGVRVRLRFGVSILCYVVGVVRGRVVHV
jgi:hypothetical protein